MKSATLVKVASALPAALFCLAGTQSAQAQTTLIDPNFVVCALGTVNVSSCGPTDPQRINTSGVTVGMLGNAGSPADNPFLLIVATPDSGPAPTFSASGISADTTGLFGSTTTNSAGLASTSWTSASADLYTFLNLPGANNSMSFGNLSSGESLAGVTTPTSFSIYEFIITAPGGPINLPAQFNIPINLAIGDYVAAYDQTSGPQVYASPFTTAGLVTTTSSTSGISSTGSTSSTSGISSTGIPEPNSSSLALLGLGLIGASFWIRRRTRP